jgi:ribose transport system permease protein
MVTAQQKKLHRKDVQLFFGRYGTVITLLCMLIFFGIMLPSFRSKENLTNMMGQAAMLSIISAGLTCCLKLGDFDLSIGAIATLAGNAVAWLMVQGYGMPISILCALLIGLTAGLVNALLVAYVGFHSLICTLATMIMIMGVTEGFTKGISIWSGIPEGFAVFGKGNLSGIPVRFIIMFIVLAGIGFLHSKTEPGRRMEAIGGNPVASRLSGIDVKRNRLAAFLLSGFCAAITGIIVTSSLMSSDANIGIGFTFPAIVACFIGAATMRIGRFHILGTLVGVLITVVATNGLVILLVPSYLMDMVRGFILLLAVLLAGLAVGKKALG